MISILGCSCLPLHNFHCLSSLSPFMISILGGSWLTSRVSQTCLPGKFANFGNLRGIMLSGVYAGVIFIRANSTSPTINCLGNYTDIALFTNKKTDVVENTQSACKMHHQRPRERSFRHCPALYKDTTWRQNRHKVWRRGQSGHTADTWRTSSGNVARHIAASFFSPESWKL